MAQETGRGVALQLTERNIHDATRRAADGGWEIVTTGGDPYVFTEPLAAPLPAGRTVLSFDFFSATGTDKFQVFLMPPLSEANSVSVAGLAHSEGWSSFAVDVAPVLEKLGGKINALRLDFGNQAGKTIRLRNVQLREPSAREKELAAQRTARLEEEKRYETALRDYLNRRFPCEVTRVKVEAARILVEGDTKGEKGELFLAELPIYAPINAKFAWMKPLPNTGRFAMTTERTRPGDNGATFDRLLSRWTIVRRDGAGYALLSHARYADEVTALDKTEPTKPRNKKGLGGITFGHPVSDFADLGLASATVNIVLNGLLDTAPKEGRTPYQFGGRTWFVNDKFVEGFDKILLEAAKHKLIVKVIILIGQPRNASPNSFSRLLCHPDADPSGIFVMPDVSSEAGTLAYAAAMNYLAQRYCRADAKFGRIHHWILHNEVNAGWVWTNAGEKTALLYSDLYQRSLRVAQLLARQYDAHSQSFVSLEHHWLSPNARIYAGREILEHILDFCHAEGDFDWALAYHPYPQNLFNPRVWEDNQPKFSFDTPKITFKNIEVLDAWMRQPRALFQGRKMRAIHLTEQGLNSPDYSEKSLQDQAAGMAYAWHKIKHLDSIQAFDYHNWVDNRGEGGLRIGLRKFPDEPGDPHGKKPIWFVYQALDTDRETAACDFAKPIIGITNWGEVRYRGEIK